MIMSLTSDGTQLASQHDESLDLSITGTNTTVRFPPLPPHGTAPMTQPLLAIKEALLRIKACLSIKGKEMSEETCTPLENFFAANSVERNDMFMQLLQACAAATNVALFPQTYGDALSDEEDVFSLVPFSELSINSNQKPPSPVSRPSISASVPSQVLAGAGLKFARYKHAKEVFPLSVAATSMYAGVSILSTHSLHKGVADDGLKLINDYVILADIGQGTSGKVKLASVNGTNEMRAIKVVPKAQMWQNIMKQPSSLNEEADTDDNDDVGLRTEVAVMKHLKHKNIIKLYEVIDDPNVNKLYMVMKYAERGPIVELQPDGTCKRMDMLASRAYMQQACRGLAYLHKHCVCHRDIKPDNLLLCDDGTLCIGDFGASRVCSDSHMKLSGLAGTPAFLSPEVFENDTSYSGGPVDVWAMGATFYTMLFGRIPFGAKTIEELEDNIRKETSLYFPFHLQQEISSSSDDESCDDDNDDEGAKKDTDEEGVDRQSMSEMIESLLRGMMERDVAKRYTAHQCLLHPFLRDEFYVCGAEDVTNWKQKIKARLSRTDIDEAIVKMTKVGRDGNSNTSFSAAGGSGIG